MTLYKCPFFNTGDTADDTDFTDAPLDIFFFFSCSIFNYTIKHGTRACKEFAKRVLDKKNELFKNYYTAFLNSGGLHTGMGHLPSTKTVSNAAQSCTHLLKHPLRKTYLARHSVQGGKVGVDGVGQCIMEVDVLM